MAEQREEDDWVPNWIRAEKTRRQDLKERYRALFDEVSAILFELDPIGINFGDNTDEYDAEAGTILPRLEPCSTSGEVRVVVYQEFVRWFGHDTAGEEARYEKVAERIWDAWIRHGRGNKEMS